MYSHIVCVGVSKYIYIYINITVFVVTYFTEWQLFPEDASEQLLCTGIN